MSYWALYYHIVWATKFRAPLITETLERFVLQTLNEKSQNLKSTILQINAVPDHVHVAVSIPPTLAIAEWVRLTKGSSAHIVNSAYPNLESTFRWQEGYGALSFGEKQLPFICDYIARQKEHHRAQTIYAALEQVE